MCSTLTPAGDAPPAVSAVIVNYNSGALLARCLCALHAAAACTRLEILVVDNGSTDGSLAGLPSEVPVTVLRAGRNLGFGRANNIGARAAHGRALLLLNSDCFVDPGLPATLLAALDRDPHAVAVGPRLRNPDGTLQPSCHNFPAPLVLFLEQSLLWRPLRRVPGLRRWVQIAGDHARPRRVDWLAGACLLVRTTAFRAVGGFDPGYFFYWEETDLCRRLQCRGGQVRFVPAAGAVHLGGGSSNNPALRPEFFRSLYRFYRRHYGPARQMGARGVVAAMAGYKAARAGVSAWRAANPGARQAAIVDQRGWLAVLRV